MINQVLSKAINHSYSSITSQNLSVDNLSLSSCLFHFLLPGPFFPKSYLLCLRSPKQFRVDISIYSKCTHTFVGMALIFSTSPMHCNCKTPSVLYNDFDSCLFMMDIPWMFFGGWPINLQDCFVEISLHTHIMNIDNLFSVSA